MSKDQYHVQILRTLYLYGILLPLVLYIAKRSTLKRASRWSLKQMITLSGSRDIGNLVSGDLVITDWSADCYQWTVNVLSNHPRWMFKKNSMEFFVGLQPYLYYYYSGCTLESHNHMFFSECSMITWPCHVIWLTESPPYLYPYSIVCFEVLD